MNHDSAESESQNGGIRIRFELDESLKSRFESGFDMIRIAKIEIRIRIHINMNHDSNPNYTICFPWVSDFRMVGWGLLKCHNKLHVDPPF